MDDGETPPPTGDEEDDATITYNMPMGGNLGGK